MMSTRFRSVKVFALVAAVALSGCSALDAFKTLAPGGPSVSAQVGKEANKQVVVGDQSKTEEKQI